MIPKPPFAKDLTLEQEIAEFERLKPRLAEVWDVLTMREEEPHTSVVVPSLTLDQSELRKLPGASFYEERLLFLLIRLRNPRARMVYVTSQPVHPIILEYYLQFLAGIPASHARSRLTLLCADDASPRSLTEKILERPRLIERIRAGIVDPSRAYLTVFNSTPLERKLAVLLGDPARTASTRTSPTSAPSRGAARSSARPGSTCPWASRTCTRPHEVEEALVELRARRPGLRRAVIKLNDSFSGEGNAALPLPRVGQPAGAARGAAARGVLGGLARRRRPTSTSSRGWAASSRSSSRPRRRLSPSAQMRISPSGEVIVDLHPRPDPGRAQRPGLPGLQLPGARRLPDADPGGGQRRSAGVARRARRRQPLRASTSSCTATTPATTGRSPPSRSTSAWAARPTPTWPCSS